MKNAPKGITGIILLLLVMTCVPVHGESGNDFNALEYRLDFHDLTSTFHMGIALGEWAAGVKVDLPMEEDQPGIFIHEMIDEICDPGNESYNPEACDFLTELFTDDVIDALNAEWNRYIADVFDLLPETALTRQLGWPLNGLGHITLDDNPWNCPAVWNPETGEYLLPPMIFPHAFAANPYGFWLLASGSMATGQIHKESGYELDGEYIFLTELIMGVRGFLLMVGFGHGGPYAGTLM